jgi:hypothetical protein
MCTGRARSRLSERRLKWGRRYGLHRGLSGLPPIARERITTSPLARRRRGGDRYRTGGSQNTNHQECSPSPKRHFAFPIQSCDALSTSLTHVRSGWFGCHPCKCWYGACNDSKQAFRIWMLFEGAVLQGSHPQDGSGPHSPWPQGCSRQSGFASLGPPTRDNPHAGDSSGIRKDAVIFSPSALR